MNVLFMCLVLSAGAEEPVSSVSAEGQPWSVVGGRTAGENRGVLEASVGWPAVSVGYLRGIAPRLDVGARASFVYGREGLVSAVLPGFKVQALLKFMLYSAGAVAVAAAFEPGPFFNIEPYGGAVWAFSLPLGLRLGIAASSALTLGISFEVPCWVQFTNSVLGSAGLNVPLLPGVGVEYFVSSNVLVFARVKMGPTIRPYRLAEFTLDAHAGIGWRP